jgi:hydroxyacylglutathione hydrolase
MQNSLTVHTVVSQPFSQNTYIAHRDGRDACVIVDPGFDPQAIEDHVTHHRLTPCAILNTHGHVDHIAGNEWMKRRWPDCPLVIGHREAEKLTDPQANLSGQFGSGIISPPADRLVSDGDLYEAADLTLHVLEIPGHSQGHVVYIWKGGSPWIVFGGDVLFQGSVGRTDFPDGNMSQLSHAIRSKLFVLPDDTLVLPGHGETTTIGHEKRTNPFVGERATVG